MNAYLPLRTRLRSLLAAADLLGLLVAGWCAYALRFEGAQFESKLGELAEMPGLIAWSLISGLLLATAAELYEPETLYRRRELAIRVLVAAQFWLLAVVLASFLQPAWAVGRGILALTLILWVAQMILTRFALTAWLRRRTRFLALVVGDPAAVEEFCLALEARPSSPWRPVDASHISPQEITHEIVKSGASLVVWAGSDERSRTMGHDLAHLHFSQVPVVAASEIWAWLEERLPLGALTPALFLHQPGFGTVHHTLFNRVTRIADIALALIMLVLTAPIFWLAALLVVLSDGFPLLYRQRRLGQYGRPFVMLKLRTMWRNAEADGPTFASEKDPRTIPVGSLLRRFRIDELPQLINVLKGEMSLVGPRPERPEFVAELTEQIPFYAFRMAVPPGITGWAQVNIAYARDLEDHKRKLEFDLYFIRERSTRLYLLTLLRTASAALVGVQRAVDQGLPAPSASAAVSPAVRPTVAASRASNRSATRGR
ncbi:MAG: exopolysaccharide biosynthesis polyprenyl glycosylphosphotransferase [Acidobacteriota bacterium]